MGGTNGSGDRWNLDPYAVGLAVLGVAGIIAEVVLSLLNHPIPGALDSIIYTCSGAVAGAYGIGRKNGAAAGNGRDVAYRPLPDPPSVKAG